MTTILLLLSLHALTGDNDEDDGDNDEDDGDKDEDDEPIDPAIIVLHEGFIVVECKDYRGRLQSKHLGSILERFTDFANARIYFVFCGELQSGKYKLKLKADTLTWMQDSAFIRIMADGSISASIKGLTIPSAKWSGMTKVVFLVELRESKKRKADSKQ